VVVLAAFIPLLIGSGGNVGAQSSTVVIRGSTPTKSTQESLYGNPAGSHRGYHSGPHAGGGGHHLGLLPAGQSGRGPDRGVSLVAISVLASTAGGTLPILFQSFGFDPALMSAPFITTIVDVLGVLLYLTLARYMLGLS
jgi:magnesium transporter